MNKFFDIAQRKEAEEKQTSEHIISKYLVCHYQKIKSLNKELQRLPSSEEFFFLQSDTSFNAFTFIPLIGEKEVITELHASTYSISRKVIDALIQLHDEGIIERVTLMISDSLIKRNPATIDYLNALISSRANFNVIYSWVHAKVAICKTKDHYYIIEGSGNWASNAQYEQYIFANSKGVYEFRKTLFTESKLRNTN
ncbi:hypothetical protein ACFFU1_16685 [Algibacter miyuki]|uniref:Phospholipase D-like domain-containing protein n=1 Tax=Algibacter miyuki TaxID=1306933 RepID=A0ABV5H3Q5_9FLAO|nr:hypothetical protein [Algibacter miyuki]MDN3665616.1 hypothetical protein [Algibacter miyuki]